MNAYPVSSYLLKYFPSLSMDIYGFPAWYWVSIFSALFIASLLASFIKRPLINILAYFFRQKEQEHKQLFIDSLRAPISIIFTLVIFLILSMFIKDPDQSGDARSIAIKIALFLSFTYLGYRLIDFSFSRLMSRNVEPRSRVSLVLPLARRVSKTLLVVMAFLVLLSKFGVDVSAFLVGLGVGGLAIALAAQKILENLFGGAVLSLDQPFKVGDYCKCADILGYVEEIGIRSTRIRTLDRTLITIPNSKLSEMHIENYMERDKIRLYTVLSMDLETPVQKLKELLSEFERILLADENFIHDFYRIRLIGMGEQGFDIEIYTYANTTELSTFSAMREQLLFNYLEKMDELKVKLAVPIPPIFVREPK